MGTREIQNGSQTYCIGERVGEVAGKYRLYLCQQEGADSECLLQIADTVSGNGALDRAAFILRELKRRSDELEDEYAAVKKDPKDFLNYGLGFPLILDSFICESQGRRRVNILAFRSVESVSQMVPLINITEKDRLRVDLLTSVWIMGKLLKLLVLTQSENISVGLVFGSNILIEPKERYVLIFDWSMARLHNEAIPIEVRCQEISRAASST